MRHVNAWQMVLQDEEIIKTIAEWEEFNSRESEH